MKDFPAVKQQAAGVISPEVALCIQLNRFETHILERPGRIQTAGAGSTKNNLRGSVRQVRGRVLSYLIRYGDTLTSDLARGLDLPPDRIDPVLASLVAEGVIVMDRDVVKIT